MDTDTALVPYQNSGDILLDMREIIEGQCRACPPELAPWPQDRGGRIEGRGSRRVRS